MQRHSIISKHLLGFALLLPGIRPYAKGANGVMHTLWQTVKNINKLINKSIKYKDDLCQILPSNGL
jgi:hypothetical protein